MSGKHAAKYKRVTVQLSKGKLSLYVGQRIHDAMREVLAKMKFYNGVRFFQVVEAFYEQGKKDGRKEMIEKMDALKDKVNYLGPGRPKK
jgi:uncharacterized protein (DUF2164 family)